MKRFLQNEFGTPPYIGNFPFVNFIFPAAKLFENLEIGEKIEVELQDGTIYTCTVLNTTEADKKLLDEGEVSYCAFKLEVTSGNF